MRPLATWLVVGSLAVLGLFAVRDAFRGQETAASSPRPERLEKRLHAPPGGATAPPIANHVALVRKLRSLGAGGVLYVTNADCRRFLLQLPRLVWTTPQGLPEPDCTAGSKPVIDNRFGVTALQVAADAIEARGEGWRVRFQGTDPTFKPDGTLTFLRGGRLFAWTVRCPRGTTRIIFEGWRMISRCPRPVGGALQDIQEVVWLSNTDFAAVAGQELAPRLIVVRGGSSRTLFQSVGARMGALQASPDQQFLAARLGGELLLFDTHRTGAFPLPRFGAGGRAITWSPEGRLVAVAGPGFVHVFRLHDPEAAVALPVSAYGLEWR
jgi:hypothetical protein